MAMELGVREWRPAFATGAGQKPRGRTLRTEAWERLAEEIAPVSDRPRVSDGRRSVCHAVPTAGNRTLLKPSASAFT
jgi:hypothetical protein